HQAGIVHRDFKPENVLVGSDGRARVADFGLARLVRTIDDAQPGMSHETASAQVSRTGSLEGTPAYMAPEQWVGATIDARTDQFSFCLALYEALAGVRPFRGSTSKELSESVLSG